MEGAPNRLVHKRLRSQPGQVSSCHEFNRPNEFKILKEHLHVVREKRRVGQAPKVPGRVSASGDGELGAA